MRKHEKKPSYCYIFFRKETKIEKKINLVKMYSPKLQMSNNLEIIQEKTRKSKQQHS